MSQFYVGSVGGNTPFGPVNITFVVSTILPTPPLSYTVLAADQFILVNTDNSIVTILLPNTTTTGRLIVIKDWTGNAANYPITVTTVGGSVTIDEATSIDIDTNFGSLNLIFEGTNYSTW